MFSFYNDQLFRLVIDYDRQRTEGMTDADMVQTLSETYGAMVKPKAKTSAKIPTQSDVESASRSPHGEQQSIRWFFSIRRSREALRSS